MRKKKKTKIKIKTSRPARKKTIGKKRRVVVAKKKHQETNTDIIFDSNKGSTDSLFVAEENSPAVFATPEVAETIIETAPNETQDINKKEEVIKENKKVGVWGKIFSFAKYPFRNLFSSMLVGLVFAGLFSAIFYVLALPYTPGETTNPDCLPGATNCTVTSAVPYTGATAAVDLGAKNFTTTGAGSLGSLTLTTTSLTVGNGGTGLSAIAAGSILGANTLNTLTAITSTSGTKVLTNTSGTITWETGSGGGASTALDNLASVAVNAVLIPGTAGALDFGSATKPWADIYLAGTSITPGTNNFKITGASTSGTRIITLPDAAGTVAFGTGAANQVAYWSATNTLAGEAQLALSRGGTAANLTASNGGIFYSTASAGAILAGTATANQVLMSGASTTPAWSTATFPAAATGTGTILRADGTNWAATTATYPTTTTANRVLYSTGTNVVGDNANLTFDGTNLAVAGVGDSQILSSSGTLILGSDKTAGNDETLTFDFETTSNKVAVTSATGVTVLDLGTIALSSGSYISGTPIITSVVTSGPPGTSPADGAMIVDSGDSGRLYIRYGSAWHYIAATAGFQIPNFETTDPISGDLIKEGDIVLGTINQTLDDGALHGVWVKWDSVKAQLLAEARGELSQTGTSGDGTISGVSTTTLLDKVTNVLSTIGISIKDGITTIKQLAVEKSTTDVARIKKMEMVDADTGEIYCTWIKAGEWVKTKGECGSLAAADASVQPTQQEETAQQLQNAVSQVQQVVQQSQQAIEQSANNAVAQVQQAGEQAQQQVQENSNSQNNTPPEPASPEITPAPAEQPPVEQPAQPEQTPAPEVTPAPAEQPAAEQPAQPEQAPAPENKQEETPQQTQGESDNSKDKKEKDNKKENDQASIGNLIRGSTAGLLNAVWDFVNGIFNLGFKKVSSLPIMKSTTASLSSPLENLWQAVIKIFVK